MTAIGVAEEYVVVIADATSPATAYTTSAPILAVVPFTDLQWGRVMSDISTGKVSIPIPTSDLGVTLRGWDMALDIYRNGDRQWSGPIVGWRPGLTTQISAHDVMAWTKKRRVASDRTFTDDDVLDAIALLMDDAQVLAGETFPFDLLRPDVLHSGLAFGAKITQSWASAELQTIYDAVLAPYVDQVGLYFTALPGSAWWDDASLQEARNRPTLDVRTVLDDPVVEVNCLDVCDHLFVGDDRFGVDGYSTVYGVSGLMEVYTAFRCDGTFDRKEERAGKGSSQVG